MTDTANPSTQENLLSNHLAHTAVAPAPQKFDLNQLDPELAVIVPELPAALADINRDNIGAVRAALAANGTQPVPTPVQIEERTIQTKHARQPDVRVLIYRKPSTQSQAGLIWIHGGGYILGSAEDDRARGIAEQLDCVVISVDYRLAPEHPFPAGIEDCQAALLWVAEHANDLGIDASRLAIGGASAGGGMAAGLALLNRDQGGPSLAMQLLLYPMIDNLHDTPSGRITNHLVWNRQTSFNAWEMYLGGVPGKKASPYAAAARAGELAGLPRTYLCVGAEDLFRDETIEYARRLIAAGVSCELSVYPGLFHGSDMFMPSARVCQRLENGFIHALGQAIDA